MGILVLLRHGQSVWNQKNLFTGWVNVPLSAKGVEEALAAGDLISDIHFHKIYTSTLTRAQDTALLAMTKSQSGQIPILTTGQEGEKQKIYGESGKKDIVIVEADEALNERYYGDLQGQNKEEIKEKFGEEQVLLWRRSYATRPPNGESLQMTIARSLPFFKKKILPHLEKGENILISAHGNTLRGILMFIEGLSEEDVVKLEVPTGKPIFYTYKKGIWTKK